MAAAGIAVPTGEVVHEGSPTTIRPPFVVRPVDADNSLGVSLVRDPSEYDGAVRRAVSGSTTRTALVETHVE